MAKEQGRILVVDDDPLNVLRMTRDLLQQGPSGGNRQRRATGAGDAPGAVL
jgi:hypothetical protein